MMTPAVRRLSISSVEFTCWLLRDGGWPDPGKRTAMNHDSAIRWSAWWGEFVPFG